MSEEALQQRIDALEEENARLRKIRDVLIQKVEAPSAGAASYAAFENSVVLAEQVRHRTAALRETLAELEHSNWTLRQVRDDAAKAHQRLRDAIESTSDAFALFDAEGLLITSNSVFRNIWRLDDDALAGVTLEQCMTSATVNGVIVACGNADSYLLDDGRWLQMSKRRTGEGGTVVLFSDITELKASEAAERERALAEKMQVLQSTVDNLSQGVAFVNKKGYLEICNALFADLAGLSPDQVRIGMNFRALLNRSRFPALASRLDGDLDSLPQPLEISRGRYVEISAHPLADGASVYTFTDVSEHIRHLDSLRESERWVRLITDQVPALITYVGADRRYRFTNRGYARWYGLEQAQILNLPLTDVHHELMLDLIEPHIDEVLSGDDVAFEIEEINAQGEQRHLQKTYVPDRSDKGHIKGFFVLVSDITDSKRAALELEQAYQSMEQRVNERTSELTKLNEQLRFEIDERNVIEHHLREAKAEAERANRSKTKFLAAISHDLLQPLNAARLFTGAAFEQTKTHSARHQMERASQALDDVERLIVALIDMSKLDAGALKTDIRSFRLADLIDKLGAEFRQIASQKAIRLDYIRSNHYISSDSSLLARVVRNLLTNAVRYTPEGGRVLLGCRRQGNHIRIEVWDNGPGIPSDQLQVIFQEFFRGKQEQSDKGLGLGLAIVDGISRALGHPIDVRSTLGKGSVFSVTVPIARQEAVPERPVLAGLPLGSLRGRRFLIIDNDAAICAATEQILLSWGARPESLCYCPPEERLLEQVARMDLVMVDYHLDDDLTGQQVIERLVARGVPPEKLVMITANRSPELAKKIRATGLTLLYKPLKPLRLKTTLVHLLSSQPAL